MNRYKTYIDFGDFAIPKRTASRYSKYINIERSNDTNESISSEDSDEDDIMDESANSETSIMYISDDGCQSTAESNPSSSDRSFSYPENLQELLTSEEFNASINIPVDITRAELFFMVLKFSVSNYLSFTALVNMFQFVNTIFKSPVLPHSRYITNKLIHPKDYGQFHAVCHKCKAYIGKFGEVHSVRSCTRCESKLDLKNSSNSSFFVIFDPTQQIQDLISIHENYYEYVVKERRCDRQYINDVYDSNEYRKFVKSLPEEDKVNYVSAIFNTDGAPLFKSSQYSIWPIYIMINELPIEARMQNLITCGMWFHKRKPYMKTYLGEFVNVINSINKDGIPCTIKNEERRLKLYIVSCCVDSVARPPIQGIKQFNGKFGCSWCLHPGKWVDGSMKYPLLEHPIASRNHEKTVKDMLNMQPNQTTCGIKYPSAFINLSSFNIISGFVPDYMHCCLEGVAKQLTAYHIKSMTQADVQEIDSKIEDISVSNQVSRLTRSLSCRNDWKAREWENYVLYYSVPILKEYISRDHFNHWLLFVESLYILLQEKIKVSELNEADKMLHKFVAGTEDLYGDKAMTFNIHQMLHLCESVLNWGPLWSHSTFSFESANRYLLAAIKCSNGVNSQIMRHININHALLILQENLYPNFNCIVKVYCDDILWSRATHYRKISDITYFCESDICDNRLLQNIPKEFIEIYSKIIKDGCLYESASRSKRRSNNSFARLRDKRYVQIINFIVNNQTKEEISIVKLLRTRNYFTNSYKDLQVIEKINDECSMIMTNEIINICNLIKVDEVMYLCVVPNLLHY